VKEGVAVTVEVNVRVGVLVGVPVFVNVNVMTGGVYVLVGVFVFV
jgi:hypothetical protein